MTDLAEIKARSGGFDVDAEHQPFELRAVARGLLDELRENRAEVERVTAERDTARAEVERLRVDAELGRLVREGLPAIAQHSGDEAWLRYDHLDQMWGAGYTGYAEFSSCDPDNALETVLGDVLRKA